MTTSTAQRARPDLVIASAMMIVFGLGFVFTLGWPDQSALLPRIASALGFTAGLYFVARTLIARLRSRSAEPGAVSEIEIESRTVAATDADDDEEEDVEYVFATVGWRSWARALGWIAGFFVAMALFGIFIAAGLFAVAYLRFAGRKSWLFSFAYAVILTGALYALLRIVTFIPSPPGLILPGW